jgi:putative tryptophan/tyrosine transport system substrate-binding protein
MPKRAKFVFRRREFIALLGGAAAAWPVSPRAQQTALPLIGFLHYASVDKTRHQLAAFRKGLHETGFLEGRNVAVEYRWAEGHYDRLPGLVTELIDKRPAVIVTGGGSSVALAARKGTSLIPIVFVVGIDPVAAGLVASLNRPGRNLTGVNVFSTEMTIKQIELIDQLVPSSVSFAELINPTNADATNEEARAQAAVNLLGRRIIIVRAGSEGEFELAFAEMARQRVGGLVIWNEGLFAANLPHLAVLAMRYRIPAATAFREFAVAGGLVSYGPSVTEAWRQVGIYTGRILKGDRPTDLPVVQPTKFELVINLKTAKALGLTISPTLLARADEVIE